MKRFQIVFFVAVLLMPAIALGAGTITVSDINVYREDGIVRGLDIQLTATADSSAATYPDTTINKDTSGMEGHDPKGMYLHYVDVIGNHGGTECTDDSDVFLYQKSGTVTKAVDLLDGNGVDKADDDTNYRVKAALNGVPSLQRIMDDMTVDIDGNSENSAVIYITIHLEK